MHLQPLQCYHTRPATPVEIRIAAIRHWHNRPNSHACRWLTKLVWTRCELQVREFPVVYKSTSGAWKRCSAYFKRVCLLNVGCFVPSLSGKIKKKREISHIRKMQHELEFIQWNVLPPTKMSAISITLNHTTWTDLQVCDSCVQTLAMWRDIERAQELLWENLQVVNWWCIKIQSLPEHKQQFYFRLSLLPASADTLCCTKTVSLLSFNSRSSRPLFMQRTGFQLRNLSCRSFLCGPLQSIKIWVSLLCPIPNGIAVCLKYWKGFQNLT